MDIFHNTPLKYYCKSEKDLSEKGLEMLLKSVLLAEYQCPEA